MPSPLGTHVRFASISEASSTQHLIADPCHFQGLALAFFALKKILRAAR
jgi:hypothetical protein